MHDDELRQIAQARALQTAKEWTSFSLATLSFLIWIALIMALYFWVWLPSGELPGRVTGIGTMLFIPAAIPWLARGRIIAWRAALELPKEYAHILRSGEFRQARSSSGVSDRAF